MTSFARIDYPVRHDGVARLERAARSLKQGLNSGRSAATMLLAAIVSSLLVVAGQVVETWTEGHLLAGWIVLWTVAFAAIALLAAPARQAGRVLGARWEKAAAARRQFRLDREYWQVAQRDPRVMADLSRAMGSADVAIDLRSYR